MVPRIKENNQTGKAKLKVKVPGIDDKDGVGKANSINDMFANVSAHVPPACTTPSSYYNYGVGIFGSSKTNSTDSPLKITSVFSTYN